MAAKSPTLAEYATAQVDTRTTSWCDTLPEDVQRQLIEVNCSVAMAVRWLKELGYAEATNSKVDNWRRNRRSDRQPG
jgi:hypothetical protein